ncbi:thioredoxin-like domain-containing protein [Aquimarina macrocephali]|uniref:thioredoxin-like domain-containing protein n=1 Tax=Aquimarina macrocephali TaxID=666563 RepID=UPI003F6770A8
MLRSILKKNDTSLVNEGNFYFEGNIDYPHMFTLITRFTNRIEISDLFFIEKGSYDLRISFLQRDTGVLITKSKSQDEYELLKLTKLDAINQKIWTTISKEKRKQYRVQKDSVLVSYLKKRPNSYVALWLLIDSFCSNDLYYNKYYEESLNYFSKEIKDTYPYKVFKKKVVEAKNFSFVDKAIPLKNIALKEDYFDLKKFKNKKYILIDFWYSYCRPCLSEMPAYKPIYNKYKEKGFEIISISVDKTKDSTNWKKTINKKNFDWIHYLDENGIETYKLNIRSFPTTFLVKNNGEIIVKDISPEKLELFLSKELQ